MNDTRVRTGGGWTFKDTFTKYAAWAEPSTEEDADVIFIPGATMVPLKYEKPQGKKLIVRLDNALRHSRNKGKGMRQMSQLIAQADAIVYQSTWAHHYLNILNLDGVPEHIVVNGCDQSLYKPDGQYDPNAYIYVKSSTDEGKEWIRVWYEYQERQRLNPEAILMLAGKFGEDLIENNFDFWNDERYNYYGFVNPITLVDLYRIAGTLYMPFFNDACSNTLIEYLSSNPTGYIELIGHRTGGVPDILEGFKKHGREWLGAERMVKEYQAVFEGVV